jgi:hypothetical protein
MKRETGKGSVCSSLYGVQEPVIVRAATTQSINQLRDCYCLVVIIIIIIIITLMFLFTINTVISMVSYLYCLNTHCKQYEQYLHMQTLSKFTILCYTHAQKCNFQHTLILQLNLISL